MTLQAVARMGDMGVGVCPCHGIPVSYTTIFTEGAPTHFTDDLNTAWVTTVGVSSCGHSTIALTGSPVVDIQGNAIHRVGDTGQNCGPYVTITGSPNVDSE
jgi:uncharacterized Zn-binding protein involved in type VI secretion